MCVKDDHVVKENDLKTKQKIQKYAESLSSGIAYKYIYIKYIQSY